MNESPPRGPSRTLQVVIIALLLAILCGGAIPAVGIVAAIAIPNFVVMQMRAKRAEVPGNLEGIRTAELAYQAAFDRFLPVPEPVPVDPAVLDRELRAWPQGTPFQDLGWQPSGLVRGTYWVEVAPDGGDFTVHGACDVDGDGDPAHYTATHEQRPHLETGARTY